MAGSRCRGRVPGKDPSSTHGGGCPYSAHVPSVTVLAMQGACTSAWAARCSRRGPAAGRTHAQPLWCLPPRHSLAGTCGGFSGGSHTPDVAQGGGLPDLLLAQVLLGQGLGTASTELCFLWHLVKKAGAGRWHFSAGDFHQFLIALLVEAFPLVIGFPPSSVSSNLIFSFPSHSASLCSPVSPYSISVISFPFRVKLLQMFTLTLLPGAWLTFSWIIFPSLTGEQTTTPPTHRDRSAPWCRRGSAFASPQR